MFGEIPFIKTGMDAGIGVKITDAENFNLDNFNR